MQPFVAALKALCATIEVTSEPLDARSHAKSHAVSAIITTQSTTELGEAKSP